MSYNPPFLTQPITPFLTCPSLRLVLVGGGAIPFRAAERFVEWAGGRRSSIVVIPWASGHPGESFERLADDLSRHSPGSLSCAPDPASPDAGELSLKMLSSATGVFFGGGDQNKLMGCLRSLGLVEAVREAAERGCTFGGTSAGTAVMSERMITGQGREGAIGAGCVELAPGLGLLRGVVVDQHFIVRSRLNRLISAVTACGDTYGLGVDEDNAVAVAGNRYVEVLGDGPNVLVDSSSEPGRFTIDLLQPGDLFDLAQRGRAVAFAHGRQPIEPIPAALN